MSFFFWVDDSVVAVLASFESVKGVGEEGIWGRRGRVSGGGGLLGPGDLIAGSPCVGGIGEAERCKGESPRTSWGGNTTPLPKIQPYRAFTRVLGWWERGEGLN